MQNGFSQLHLLIKGTGRRRRAAGHGVLPQTWWIAGERLVQDVNDLIMWRTCWLGRGAHLMLPIAGDAVE